MQRIILASESKQRKMVMDSFGFEYTIIPANIDEKAIRDKNLSLRVKKIAIAKAKSVAKNNDGVVIAADTFCVLNGIVLEKPKDLAEAKEMLKMQSNKDLLCYTGFCYIDKLNKYTLAKTVLIKYSLRELSDEEINKFVENNPVLQWSAAFCPCYVYQSTFIEKMSGSFTGGLYGLPTELVISCLKKSGFKI
jgi:septum formation protein